MHETGLEGLEGRDIEVWNGVGSPKGQIVCLVVSAVCAVAAVLVASSTGGPTLYWRLRASVIGFTVKCFLVTPKQEVAIVDEMVSVDPGEDGAK